MTEPSGVEPPRPPGVEPIEWATPEGGTSLPSEVPPRPEPIRCYACHRQMPTGTPFDLVRVSGRGNVVVCKGYWRSWVCP